MIHEAERNTTDSKPTAILQKRARLGLDPLELGGPLL